VILATHDLGDLRDTVDRCYVLDRGRVAAEGSPDQILGDSALLERTNLVHRHRRRSGAGSHVHEH
jgi:cobalt/nickel transport system ATP-binding protein